MDIVIDRDLPTGVTVVELSGTLTAGSGNDVLALLLKCAAECPAAVIADLSGGVHLGSDARPGLFATAFHRAMRGHGVPVLVVAADPVVSQELTAFRTFAHLYPSRADAVRALKTWVPRWLHETLNPEPASVTHARGLAGDGCLSWGLMHLRDPARAIASELAANAIEHTGGPFQVTVSYTGVFLRLAVRDRSRELPRLIGPTGPATSGTSVRRGPGLRIVAATATNWGTYLVRDGKVVWALLRAYPTRSPELLHSDWSAGRANGTPGRSRT